MERQDLINRLKNRDPKHVDYFDKSASKKKEKNKEMIKYKNNTNSKLVFKLKFITNKDYESLDPYDCIKYDKRGFFAIFWVYLKSDNALINLFFHYSILEPFWIKVIMFYFNLSLLYTTSAFFFSDDYIDARAELPEEDRVIIIILKYNLIFYLRIQYFL